MRYWIGTGLLVLELVVLAALCLVGILPIFFVLIVWWLSRKWWMGILKERAAGIGQEQVRMGQVRFSPGQRDKILSFRENAQNAIWN